MKTLRELKNEFLDAEENKEDHTFNIEAGEAYYQWYEDAIKWIYEDIKNAGTISVGAIEKYLQDLINK